MSLYGMDAVNVIGDLKFPPGDVYTAPVVDSVSDEIWFNVPSMIQGEAVTDVHLTLKSGCLPIREHSRELIFR